MLQEILYFVRANSVIVGKNFDFGTVYSPSWPKGMIWNKKIQIRIHGLKLEQDIYLGKTVI